MGSCVSRSSAAAAEPRQAVEAKAMVMGLDGSMARLAAPVNAREALGEGDDASCFVCSADELDFDAPVRALAAEEALQPGQLYFALPMSMLRRPLSGGDMATLAVKATAALSNIDMAEDRTAGVSSSTRRKDGDSAARKRQQQASRVAPLVVVSSIDTHAAAVVYSDQTVGKTTGKGPRRRAGVRRLSAVLEASE